MDQPIYKLSEVFLHYNAAQQSEGIIVDIVNYLTNEKIDRKSFDKLLNDLGARKTKALKKNLLELVMFYIKYCLIDHYLDEEEVIYANNLKTIFGIMEGDFNNYLQDDVKVVLISQVSRILTDKKVDRAESLHQSDLQGIFGLSYDQYLEITKDQISQIVDDLINKISADSVVTGDERRQLIQQILDLDTAFILSEKQKRILDNEIRS